MRKSSALFLVFTCVQLIFIKDSGAFKFSKETCQEYNLGSNWYCEKEQEEDLTSPNEIMARDVPPEQKALLLNSLWEVQQKRAVITGKKEDLENLLITQKYITKLGVDFAKKMMRITETIPEYSGSSSYYQQISEEFIKTAKQEETLRLAKDRYAIAFIYATECPYCKRQLPILYSLRESFGITILGVSADGGVYPGLDQVVNDKSVTNDPNVQAFPTIMLVDSKTGKRLFIAKGLTTKDRLTDLIYKKILEVENA